MLVLPGWVRRMRPTNWIMLPLKETGCAREKRVQPRAVVAFADVAVGGYDKQWWTVSGRVGEHGEEFFEFFGLLGPVESVGVVPSRGEKIGEGVDMLGLAGEYQAVAVAGECVVDGPKSPDRSRPRPRRSGHPHPSGMITVKPADGAVPPPPVLQGPGERDDAVTTCRAGGRRRHHLQLRQVTWLGSPARTHPAQACCAEQPVRRAIDGRSQDVSRPAERRERPRPPASWRDLNRSWP